MNIDTHIIVKNGGMAVMRHSFDDWYLHDMRLPGVQEKYVLEKEGNIGIFKFRTIDREETQYNFDDIAELIAFIIAESLGIRSAEVILGTFEGKKGCFVRFIDRMKDGSMFKSAYSAMESGGEDREDYYIESILSGLDELKYSREFWEMIVLDCIIANTDRHGSNWAVYKENGEYKMVDLFDHGFSMMYDISKRKIDRANRNYYELKRIALEGNSRILVKGYKQKNLIKVLKIIYDEYFDYMGEYLERIMGEIDIEYVSSVIRSYYNELSEAEEEYCELAIKILEMRVEEIRMGVL